MDVKSRVLPAWETPDVVNVERVTFTLWAGVSLWQRLAFDVHGKLVDFAMGLMELDDRGTEVRSIARVDCAHGSVHMHVDAERFHLLDIRSQQDVESGCDAAWERLVETGRRHRGDTDE